MGRCYGQVIPTSAAICAKSSRYVGSWRRLTLGLQQFAATRPLHALEFAKLSGTLNSIW